MNKTKIDYLNMTWNPTHGCSPISEGCKNCWARRLASKMAAIGASGYLKDDPFRVTCMPGKLLEPSKVKKPARVGVSFMGDLFHGDMPYRFIEKVWDTMSYCPQHTFLILTKRPVNAQMFYNYMNEKNRNACFGNIWIGVSAENQKTADERIPILLEIPAAVRFVSVEPMLGIIEVSEYLQGFEHGNWHHKLPRLDWVICGAESGGKRRPFSRDWAKSLLEQCQDAGVPFFYKQGISDKGNRIRMPRLKGKIWNQLPQPGEK